MKRSELKTIIKECLLEENMINEADEITFNDLDAKNQKVLHSIENAINKKHDVLFSGIHGNVVVFSRGMVGGRLSIKTIKNLAKIRGLRWVDGSSDGISVGF